MLIALHKNATTTPSIRAAIQQATGSDYERAKQFNASRDRIRKWRVREGVRDASHTPHSLQMTLNAAHEELVVHLRITLRQPLDDLLAVIREFMEPSMSRSSLARLLQRRDIWILLSCLLWSKRPHMRPSHSRAMGLATCQVPGAAPMRTGRIRRACQRSTAGQSTTA